MPIEDSSPALSAMGAILLELFARQIALFGLLRSQPEFDEQKIRTAVRQAHEELARIPGVATLQSQASAQRLEELEKALRVTLFPRK